MLQIVVKILLRFQKTLPYNKTFLQVPTTTPVMAHKIIPVHATNIDHTFYKGQKLKQYQFCLDHTYLQYLSVRLMKIGTTRAPDPSTAFTQEAGMKELYPGYVFWLTSSVRIPIMGLSVARTSGTARKNMLANSICDQRLNNSILQQNYTRLSKLQKIQ